MTNTTEHTPVMTESQGRSISGGPGTYRVITGEEPILPKDLTITNATLDGLVNYIEVRRNIILEQADSCHLLVNEANSSITLVLGEFGGSRGIDQTYLPCTRIVGRSGYSKDRGEIKSIMANNWSPHSLAMHLRERPYLFEDTASWSRVVDVLRNLSIKVSKTVEDTSSDAGARKKAVNMLVDSGTEPLEWNWRYSIYEGTAPVLVSATMLYQADENMSDIVGKVFNPHFVHQERAALKKMLNTALGRVAEVLEGSVPVISINGRVSEE